MNKNMLKLRTSYTTKAEMETMVEVRCPLSKGRKIRDVDDQTNIDVVARGYYISVSNDGTSFSEEDIMVVYDSTCLSCIVNGTTTSCEVKVCFML